MILITSAAYVEREFQIEFGALPPSLLPVGNLRLFELQVGSLRGVFGNEKIILSLPENTKLNPRDIRILKFLDVTVIYLKEGLSLGVSIQLAIKANIVSGDVVRILHGDTLLEEFDTASDCIAISNCEDNHSWEIDNQESSNSLVWCGYFAFKNAKDFLECLSFGEGDFVSAVRLYDSKVKMKRVEIKPWYDFGHTSTYFRSRSKLTTERSFNLLKILDGSVTKTGLPVSKIKAEYSWFKNLDDELLTYTPKLTKTDYGTGRIDHYQIEYLPLPPLNEVYVHGCNDIRYWRKIFTLLDDFLCICMKKSPPPNQLNAIKLSASSLVKEKTLKRLSAFSREKPAFNLSRENELNGEILPSISDIVGECFSRISREGAVIGLSHGDLCLSNILFDSRTQRIKVIDPRGLDYSGLNSSYGDLRYDFAKLTHSVVGLYDYIISEAYTLDVVDHANYTIYNFELDVNDNLLNIQKLFKSKLFFNNMSYLEVMPETILLFFSMLPLHADKPRRQMAFVANGLRLYSNMIHMEQK